jgi:hypothetical protein
MQIHYYIISLLTEERLPIIEYNIKKLPQFITYKAVNGYDIEETVKALKESGLNYRNLETPTYGTLANFLSKFNLLKFQIEKNLEYMCFIEDDLKTLDGFEEHVIKYCNMLRNNRNLAQIRLDTWGEGYITSVEGAKRIVARLEKDGIIENIDNQLRVRCKPEYHVKDTPWELVVPTNKGDCLKTEEINTDLFI